MNYKLNINLTEEDCEWIANANEWIVFEYYAEKDPGVELWADFFKPVQRTVLEWEDNWYLYMSTETSSVQPSICCIPDSAVVKRGAYIFGEDMRFISHGVSEDDSCICEIRNECSDYNMLLFGLACIIKNSSKPIDETAVPIIGQCVLHSQKMLAPQPDTVKIFLSSHNGTAVKRVVSDPLVLDYSRKTEWTVEYNRSSGCFVSV